MGRMKVNKDKKGNAINKKITRKRANKVFPFDVQPISQREREIFQLQEETLQKEKLPPNKRQKRPKNRLIEESSKLGYVQQPWENETQLIRRIEGSTRKELEAEILKAKFDATGRDKSEIAKDYAELDAKQRRRKEQKRARYENLRRAKEAKEAARRERKALRRLAASRKINDKEQKEEDTDESGDNETGKSVLVRTAFLDTDEKPGDSDELSYDISEEDDDDDFRSQEISDKTRIKPIKSVAVKSNRKNGIQKASSSGEQPNVEKNDSQQKRRMGKSDKMRLKRKTIREIGDRELLLNAREVIPFGERADAPPQFTGKYRKSINEARAQAGKMDLLLKKNLQLESEKHAKSEAEHGSEVGEDDFEMKRQRVIGLYRRQKARIASAVSVI